MINAAQKAYEYLEIICREFPNRSCTDADSCHEKVREFIKSELIQAGYAEEQLTEQAFLSNRDSREVRGTNLLLMVEGVQKNRQIIIGSHYDGDGCGDNASGTALLLAVAVGLKGKTLPVNTIFAFWDQEEIGCNGSTYYASEMDETDIKKTIYCLNMDSLMFGDYCNLYGGYTDEITGETKSTEVYSMACRLAGSLGYEVYGPEELNGYFKEHGTGPELNPNGLFTSPWTKENPAPIEQSGVFKVYSPTTIPMSDHKEFIKHNIPVIYFEATNWFVKGESKGIEYIGYYETYREDIGNKGMFMNTEFDTLENLKLYFPGRAEEHMKLYSELLTEYILNLPIKVINESIN